MEIAGLSKTSPLNRFTVLLLMVVGLMDFENVRTICVFNPTLVVPLDGMMATVGGVWSTVLAVVNVPNLGYTVLPASSVNPFTNIPVSYTHLTLPTKRIV